MRDISGGETCVEAAIASVAARCLRPSGAFDLDTPFALLGMDSLGTIEMAAALEQTLGHELPPELLLECADGRSLAARITQLRATGRIADRDDPFEQMLADAVLPGDVWPARQVVTSADLRHAKRILLTGATGFLGTALLDELITRTEAEIVCLNRQSRGSSAGRPIVQVSGDLAHPRLGLSEAEFHALADGVDAVLHCGASVNWVFSYAALRGPNVLGTQELLRLACRRGIPFHFISSVSVCYSSGGPHSVDESFDALPQIRGVHLGYAQTKIVAESLVREAHTRGLPARIYRPALISGDSTTGRYNSDDLITALVRGCVRMGTAPDLDWKLDCVPVDFVARAIVKLSGERGPVFHVGHQRPRHWRECVLWMRMYGYPIRLVPYHTWLRQLDRESADPSHPLRPLRTFFLDRPAGARGLTMPEMYEEGRRTHAESVATRAHLASAGLSFPSLDASLLDTYFRAFQDRGDVPAPRHDATPRKPHPTPGIPPFTCDFLGELLNRHVVDVQLTDAGSDDSIVSELTAWRSKRPTGLFRANVRLDDSSVIDLRLKVKAPDKDVIAVGESLAALLDPSIGIAYARWKDRLGFTASHIREIEIYRQTDARFRRHAPLLLGSLTDQHSDRYVMALENVRNATLVDSADDPSGWGDDQIRAAIEGVAALQAIWHGREAELRAQPWIGFVQSTTGMSEMSDLWSALAHHAAPAFSSWAHPDIGAIHRKLIATISTWWPWMEEGPRTLIHYDFNPRNVLVRGDVLCAYDWELATLGAPQRDLAEFLCFVLRHDTDGECVRRWSEHHRLCLQREIGAAIDSDVWRHGFQAGLYDFLVNRLSIYMVVHRIRAQAFLPRVVRTWRRLYELFPFEAHE